MAKDDNTDLAKEMKERIKVEIPRLLSSFLDPRFKLLEEIENEMSQLIECPMDDATATSLLSASNTSECGDTVMTPPPNKKSKGLSKFLGHCPGNSQDNALTPCWRVKQELLKPSTIGCRRVPT